MIRHSLVRLITLVAVVALGFVARHADRRLGTEGAEVFSERQAGFPIVVPAGAVAAERRAADLVSVTLAKAARRPRADFPILVEGVGTPRRAIFVGTTRRAAGFLPAATPAPFDSAVGIKVGAGSVVVRSERRDSIEIAASWFLERYLGAHWFMPGPLGEVIPLRRELRLAAASETVRPGFISRDLGGIGGVEGREWDVRNRLEKRFDHSHNLGAIFRPDDLRREPRMAPMRDGRRYFPGASEENWQPDLTNAAAIRHAANAANRAFAADPARVSFSLSENDSARFDDSAATLAAVSPPRFFRGRPDYSDLVFGFANAVAERVRLAHPNRWLPAYAYYWAENSPRFPVEKNVVPYLTADRAQWFDPDFAAEDRALIERWTHSGAGIVGVYDYLYGAPFLVPRPLLSTVRESIPFAHRAGVRAYYAEIFPNWALDGPKPWLAARLMWAPDENPDELLATYYREFWAESAGPMREFFARCERIWLEQPRPGYWIKYFQDEQQALLFPRSVRLALRASLDEARRLARTPEVGARLEMVEAGFSVTEAFADFCEVRERFNRLARDERAGEREVIAAWQSCRDARAEFLRRNADVRQWHPLALAPQKIELYLRSGAEGAAVRHLLRSVTGRQALQENSSLLPEGATWAELDRLFREGRERLVDPRWRQIVPRPIGRSVDFEWIQRGAWQASGEPAQNRTIRWADALRPATTGARSLPAVSPDPGGIPPAGETGSRVLHLAGCRQEFLVQWLPATAGALYAARVSVRAKVSPGNQTFLIVNFLDERQRLIGAGRIDRLPVGEGTQDVLLNVVVRAPANARYVGFGLRVIHQVNDDFAEFWDASLRELTGKER